MRSARVFVPPCLALSLLWFPLAGCVVRPLDKPSQQLEQQCSTMQPQFTDKEVDLLFVIDNSDSMRHEQTNLAKQFPRLIRALRSSKLGGKLPNLRIGVVSSDLGAGSLLDVPGCTPGGDQARLQRAARVPGCTAPRDRWISYHEGVTNIPNGAGKDPVAQVQQAFSCIAQLGIKGCGFEQPLEVARRALDPAQNRNPGFLRNAPAQGRDALLAVVFITDEDDCSASNPQLFDRGRTDLFGPFTSYRCFEHGVSCQCPGGACNPRAPGPRSSCRPGGKHLHDVQRYIDFFRKLKRTPDGKPNYRRVIMAAIAGDTEQVSVQLAGGVPTVNRKCGNGFPAKAAPAIRLKSLVHAFAHALTPQEVADIKAKRSTQPHFVDSAGVWREENFTTICSADFSAALERVGRSIVANLGTICLTPPLTDSGSVICKAGDELGKDRQGASVTCQQGCLDRARFTVQEVSAAGRRPLRKCPARLFDPKVSKDRCGKHCPCWRVVPHNSCAAAQAKGARRSPYALQIMRPGPAPKGTYLSVDSLCATQGWGSPEFAALPQCW